MRSLALLLLLGACGTYSQIRPADNLKKGQFEASAGLAANTLPEVVTVFHGAIGMTDWLEVEGQFEVYSAFLSLRAQLMSSEKNGFALSIGAGAGVASLWFTLNDSTSSAAPMGEIVAGRRFGEAAELYLSNKLVYLINTGYVIDAVRAGVRFSVSHFHLGIEGGITFHHDILVLGEATGYIGLHF